MDQLRIERLSLGDLNTPEYRQLVAQQYGAGVEAHIRYYQWLLGKNPAARPDEALVCVARDGDRFVGHRGLIPAEVDVGGQVTRVSWGVDLFVLPTHQGRNLGARLMAADATEFAASLSLGQSQAGHGSATKNGFRGIGDLVRYTRLLRPLRAGAKRILDKLNLRKSASALLGSRRGVRSRRRDDVVMETVTSFNDRLGDPSDLRGTRWSHAGVRRSAAFLQWRYIDHPFFHYEVRRLPLDGGGEAYVIWRLIDDSVWRRAFLVDVIYPADLPVARLASMLAAVLRCMRADGAEVMQCQTSDRAVIEALGRSPFAIAKPGLHFLYRHNDPRVRIPTAMDQWLLFTGDCDADTATVRGQGAL
jgi:GNAT superfamily N-acetyltransferase